MSRKLATIVIITLSAATISVMAIYNPKAIMAELESLWKNHTPPNDTTIKSNITIDSSSPKLTKDDIKTLVIEASNDYNVPPELIWSVISVESNFNPLAHSNRGAIGLMQLMPSTAAEFGATNPYEPRENIRAGTRYLQKMLKRFNGNHQLALAAYNAGPSQVKKYGGIPPFPQTKAYVKKVLKSYHLAKKENLLEIT